MRQDELIFAFILWLSVLITIHLWFKPRSILEVGFLLWSATNVSFHIHELGDDREGAISFLLIVGNIIVIFVAVRAQPYLRRIPGWFWPESHPPKRT